MQMAILGMLRTPSGTQSAWSECRSEISAGLKNFNRGISDGRKIQRCDQFAGSADRAEQTTDGFVKKQLFVTRILAAAGCVLAAAVIAVFCFCPADAADYQSGTGDAGGSDRHATDGAGDADGYSDAV